MQIIEHLNLAECNDGVNRIRPFPPWLLSESTPRILGTPFADDHFASARSSIFLPL